MAFDSKLRDCFEESDLIFAGQSYRVLLYRRLSQVLRRPPHVMDCAIDFRASERDCSGLQDLMTLVLSVVPGGKGF